MSDLNRSKNADTDASVPRRRFFLGASVATAAAAATAVVAQRASLGNVEAAADAAVAPVPAPERGGGYTLSEHVKHYYQTTRVL